MILGALNVRDEEASSSGAALSYTAIDPKEAKEDRFPARVAGEYRVHISRSAYDSMRAHAATTSDVELCGVLVGQVCRDGQGVFLKVTAIIEGEGANNYGSQVTFTHQTWNHIHQVKDQRYPAQRIVGWYHTHPGFGVFLSGMDSFIQENFFNQPYQVAIVLETKKNLEGCFAWVDGHSEPLKRYWVGDEEVSLATGEVEPFEGTAEKRPSRQPAAPAQVGSAQRVIDVFGIIILILVAATAFLTGRIRGTEAVKKDTIEAVQSEIYSILEFASLNTAASADFADVRQHVLAVKDGLADSDAATTSARLDDIATLIDGLSKTYEKDRTEFRRELAGLIERPANLSEKVNLALQREDWLQELFVQLPIMRIGLVIGREGPVDAGRLDEVDRRILKVFLDEALALGPQNKSIIEQRYPGLIEYYYPSGAGASDAAAGGLGEVGGAGPK